MRKNVPEQPQMQESLVALSLELVALAHRLTGTLEATLVGAESETAPPGILEAPNPDMYPLLSRQLKALPTSRFDSMGDLSERLQIKIIQSIAKKLDGVPTARGELSRLQDYISRLNEKHDLDLEMYSARGDDDLLVLVDRPTGHFAIFFNDDEIAEGGEPSFAGVELDLPANFGEMM